MPYRRLTVLLSLALAGALSGCAGKRPVEPLPSLAPATAEVPPALPPLELDLGGFRDRLLDAETRYREGIELIAGGEETAGEAAIGRASEDLSALAAECAEASNCDALRVWDAFNALIGEQSIALKQQAARIRALEASLEQADEPEREPGTSPFVSEMPELGKAVNLLRGTDLREIISLNGPVRAAIDDWLTWLRPMLMEAHENYRFLRAEIAPVYEEAGLPEALLFAMIATETGGKVHAYSRAGAAGLLQFMRRTGQQYGLGVVDGFDTRLDPASATQANVGYLNDRFEELSDSLEMALAAYNGGENRVRGLHHRTGGAGFWDKRVYYALPRETREYVPRVLAAAWLFLHPEDYGLEFPSYRTERATLRVEQDIAIDELGICLGQAQDNRNGWFRTLRNLNPRLEPGERVPAGGSLIVPAILIDAYHERCLDGELWARARKLHDANFPDGDELVPYVVRSGDTLGRIASRFRCASVAELADINRIRPPRYVIHVGQVLSVPACH